jgi:hypothetical protein
MVVSPRRVLYSKIHWPTDRRLEHKTQTRETLISANKDVNMEAEETTELEAVTEQRLLKIQQTKKTQYML